MAVRPAVGHAVGAVLAPDRSAVINDQRHATVAELDRRTIALSIAMVDLGINTFQPIGVLAHNHADMVETMIAAGELEAVLCCDARRPHVEGPASYRSSISLAIHASFTFCMRSTTVPDTLC